MERGALNKAGLTRAVSAALLTIFAQFSLTLVVARYNWLSPFNGLWMLGVPVAIGLSAFRTWPGKIWSLAPLFLVGILAMMAAGLLW